eukprot:TRINITY_DN5146_c0_g1_i1.p2 TRINITY_DN5146_c0_g1~~TRINITY_DN5146_c0_g1_i1.p2  ORF type:complete len:275 (+),score=-16.03 TRINITY_DN5146_c0_g1_i1:543-1367(+)
MRLDPFPDNRVGAWIEQSDVPGVAEGSAVRCRHKQHTTARDVLQDVGNLGLRRRAALAVKLALGSHRLAVKGHHGVLHALTVLKAGVQRVVRRGDPLQIGPVDARVVGIRPKEAANVAAMLEIVNVEAGVGRGADGGHVVAEAKEEVNAAKPRQRRGAAAEGPVEGRDFAAMAEPQGAVGCGGQGRWVISAVDGKHAHAFGIESAEPPRPHGPLQRIDGAEVCGLGDEEIFGLRSEFFPVRGDVCTAERSENVGEELGVPIDEEFFCGGSPEQR